MLADGRRVILMTAVGTFKKGIVGAPNFDFGVIEQRGELYLVRRLRDLQKQLSAPKGLANRPAIKLPEINIPKVRPSANNPQVELTPAWGWDAFGQAIEEPPRRLRPPGRRCQRPLRARRTLARPKWPAGPPWAVK